MQYHKSASVQNTDRLNLVPQVSPSHRDPQNYHPRAARKALLSQQASCPAWVLHMPTPTAPSTLMTLAYSRAQTSLGYVCLSFSVPKKLTSTGRSNLGPSCLISGCFLNYRVTYSKGWPNLLVPLPPRTNLHMIPYEAPSPRLTF